jgi:hypothetical protein
MEISTQGVENLGSQASQGIQFFFYFFKGSNSYIIKIFFFQTQGFNNYELLHGIFFLFFSSFNEIHP